MTDIDIELLDADPIDVEFGEVTQTGGGSVTSYNALTNKPQINSVTLVGNKSFADLGINSLIDTEVASYVEEHKSELKGDKGDAGSAGANGISCTHSWSGTTLTVTSASGTSSADLKGAKGDDGDDYVITSADYDAIATVVLNRLPSAESVSI